jgi:hypothetical protein
LKAPAEKMMAEFYSCSTQLLRATVQAKMRTSYHVFKSLSTLILRSWGWIFLALCLGSCAYHMGSPDRSLPFHYKQVTIPIFRNLSMEPSIEVAFTNSLIKEFERSKIARIVDPAQAEVVIDGQIQSVAYIPGGKKDSSSGLPMGAVLATTYDIQVVVTLTLKRQSDQSVLWTGQFTRGRSYNAPQVTLPGINTVNPLYNLSARRQNFDTLAADMMAEAHDRLTENF